MTDKAVEPEVVEPKVVEPEAVVTWDSILWDAPGWYQQPLRAGAIALSNKISFPQEAIVRVTNPGPIVHRGDVVLTIENFDPKRLVRNIMYTPPEGGTPTPVPVLPAGLGEYATRWDMDLSSYFTMGPSVPRQFIKLAIVLADNGVEFIQDGLFPITVKNNQSRHLMVNPGFENLGRTAVVNMLFGRGLQGTASFNIALLVTDTNDSNYRLPILIDPRVRNVG